MKDKFKSLGKRIVALLLSVLTITMMFPLSAFAATENLGAVSSKLDISVSKHYGHEVHTTKKGGTTYPLFCIEYGTTSPSSSYLKGKKRLWQVIRQLKLQNGYLQDITLNTATR